MCNELQIHITKYQDERKIDLREIIKAIDGSLENNAGKNVVVSSHFLSVRNYLKLLPKT